MPRKSRSPRLPRRTRAVGGGKYAQELAAEVNKARGDIRNQANEIEKKHMTKGIPFAGSKTAAALAQAFEEPVEFLKEDLEEELRNDTGDCLNKLAYYEVFTPAGAKSLFTLMQPKLVVAQGVGAPNPPMYPAGLFPIAGGRNADLNYIDGPARPDLKFFTSTNTQLQLDERAALMASVGTAMVVCKILHGTPSKSFYDNSGLEMKMIYVEDMIAHIHDMFGDVITLDQKSSDAFDRMTRDQRRNYERHLLKSMLTVDKHVITDQNAAGQNGPHDEIVAGGGTMASNIHTNPDGHAQVVMFYREKVQAMVTVATNNVGKLWFAQPDAHDILAFHPGYENNIFAHIVSDTLKVIDGSPRLDISSNLKIDASNAPNGGGDVMSRENAKKITTEILALVALHVLTYSITAVLDFYFRLADRAGVYDITEENNLISHSIFAPGLLAAMKMYGISESTFDEEMALQINTNKNVKELFKAAHNAYDTEGANKVGAKTYKSEVDTTPSWLVPKEKQLEYEKEYERTKGTTVNRGNVQINDGTGALRDFGTADDIETPGIVANVSQSVADHYATRGMQGRVNRVAGGVGAFGRTRRRSSSFGRRKKTKKTSFGRRKKTKKASFGRKKKSASFGSRKKKVSAKRTSAHRRR